MKNIAEAMDELHITRPTINRYIKKLGITPHRDEWDGRLRLLDDTQMNQLRKATRRQTERKKRKA